MVKRFAITYCRLGRKKIRSFKKENVPYIL